MDERVSESAVVLFDGVCNLCNGAVQFMIDRDPKERLRFASLQSEAGRALLTKHGVELPEGEPDSIVLVAGGRAHDGSGAALRIAARLAFPWPLLAGLLVVPWFVRDIVYYLIARNRYRWFGKAEECRVPTPELKRRFLT